MKEYMKQFAPAIANLTRKSKNAGRPVLINVISTPKKKVEQKKEYKIPKTPKVSGWGWGY